LSLKREVNKTVPSKKQKKKKTKEWGGGPACLVRERNCPEPQNVKNKREGKEDDPEGANVNHTWKTLAVGGFSDKGARSVGSKGGGGATGQPREKN